MVPGSLQTEGQWGPLSLALPACPQDGLSIVFNRLQAQLVRANPAFVRGIAGNAFSCLCIASQNLGEVLSPKC